MIADRVGDGDVDVVVLWVFCGVLRSNGQGARKKFGVEGRGVKVAVEPS